MNKPSGRTQAAVAVGLAVLLGGAWLLLGQPLRVRWQVARGAPPAGPEASASAAAALAAMGPGIRDDLLSVLRDGTSTRARKSWVATVLLRAPFFSQSLVDKEIDSPDRATARAAAWSLLGGLVRGSNFEVSAAAAESTLPGPGMPSPVDTWDRTRAIPVLVDWLKDRGDPESGMAALLLGRIPAGDPRVREALLSVVDEIPTLFAKDAPKDAGPRKLVVVNCLQALLAWARDDVDVATRVAKQVQWIQDHHLEETGWDLQYYGVWLFEVARGRGVDPALLQSIARTGNKEVRVRLAHTLETVKGAAIEGILRDLLRDPEPVVRRRALYTVRKREDPILYEMLPLLVEDVFPFIRAEAIRFAGEIRHAAPDAARGAIPILVDALAEPWPGDPPPTGSPYGPMLPGATAEIVSGSILSLYRITGNPSGLTRDEIFDQGKLEAKARALLEDRDAREAIVAQWRKTVPPRPVGERLRALAANLDHPDVDVVLRCCRELARLTGVRSDFPPGILDRAEDDKENRDLIRAWIKEGKWAPLVEAWRKRAAESGGR